jgi:UDP-N-acetylmuramoylalanine--D-glutamate ligase
LANSFARQLALINLLNWYVIEISSFQLDDIHTFRPDIAVLLNITPDHLDRYQYNFDLYTQAKFKISQSQLPTDYLLVCKDDITIQQYIQTHTIHPKILYFTMKEQLRTDGAYVTEDELIFRVNGQQTAISIHDLSLKGKHNQYNTMAAGISARVAEIRDASIRESLKTFTAIEHRMESVATIRGIEFVNDSKATNLNSVWYALETIKKKVILILGGVDKGNDYNEIKDLVQEKVKAIVCLGVDNQAIHSFFDGMLPIVDTTTTDEAVKQAYALADKGDCVLLSPACASFDLFKNYEDRGAQFKASVLAL